MNKFLSAISVLLLTIAIGGLLSLVLNGLFFKFIVGFVNICAAIVIVGLLYEGETNE